MAIKKRPPQTKEERAAAIAAFGDGAVPQPEISAPTQSSTAPAQPSAPRTARTASRRPAAEPSGDVPSTSLVRWADEELPRAIQRIAAAEDRSFHKTMLQLLRRGVDDYDAKQ
jgi:hypothetical protein